VAQPVVVKQRTPRVQQVKPPHQHLTRTLVDRQRKQPRVKYVTSDISEESRGKIAKLRNAGKGRVLLIVGNGPSVKFVDTTKLRHDRLDTMSINRPDDRIWPTTFWTFCDVSQYRRHKQYWENYQGILINSTAIKNQKPNSLQIKNLGGKGFGKDLKTGWHIGRSSVYAAMQVALWMNFERIYIIGMDMNVNGIDGQLHFYGVNQDVDPNTRRGRFQKEAEYYDYALTVLNPTELAKFVICSKNINPWGFMDKFKTLLVEDTVAAILTECDELAQQSQSSSKNS